MCIHTDDYTITSTKGRKVSKIMRFQDKTVGKKKTRPTSSVRCHIAERDRQGLKGGEAKSCTRQ